MMNNKLIERLLLMMIDDDKNTASENTAFSYLGKYVIIRGYDSGVRAGELINEEKGSIVLKDARMLRRWWASEGTGLSGIAESGLNENKKDIIKINKTLRQVKITDSRVSTIFPTTKEVERQIRERPVG